MTLPVLSFFAALVLATSFLAGVFGMAGGMILMGGLLLILPVADAMVLHGITQLASNGSRALLWWSHVGLRVVARYAIGLCLALGLFAAITFVPDQRVVFLVLGLTPFIGRALPARFVPQVGHRFGAELCGFVCTALQLLSGVSGPLLDVFFIRSDLDRREIVATKAACQIISHLSKLVYFGLLVGQSVEAALDPLTVVIAISLAVLGTSLSRRVLERLSDADFRRYTWWIVMTIGAGYVVAGVAG